jgi:hypothetical protein
MKIMGPDRLLYDAERIAAGLVIRIVSPQNPDFPYGAVPLVNIIQHEE